MTSNILTTLRKPKILDMAIVDWLLTLLFGYYLGFILYQKMNIKLCRNKFIFFTIILLILIGIYVHILFNVPTMFNYYLGLGNKPINQ